MFLSNQFRGVTGIRQKLYKQSQTFIGKAVKMLANNIVIPMLVVGLMLLAMGGTLVVRRRRKEFREQANLLY